MENENIKIVPYESDDAGKEGKIWFDEVSVSYYQKGDCEDDNIQKITLTSRNNGTARFVNMQTDENGWSMDSTDDIVDIFKDFCKRSEIE